MFLFVYPFHNFLLSLKNIPKFISIKDFSFHFFKFCLFSSFRNQIINLKKEVELKLDYHF